MKAAILETVQKKQLILFLSYFSRLLKRKARQFRFFYRPFNFCPHSLHYVSRRENHLGHSCSLLRVRAGGAAGAFPYGIHYRVAYLIFYYNFFGLSTWKRILLQFPRPRHTAQKQKKNHILVFATPLTFTALLWMSPSHPLHKKVLS